MTEDADGYGPRPGQTPIERLLEDCRTLSPAGVERVANGWDRHADGAYRDAEQAALQAIDASGRRQEWDDLDKRLRGLTEVGEPLVAWQTEHGPVGHKAEQALVAAALALTADDLIDGKQRLALLRPMAEALPWLS